jgi:hypothetical protein
MGRREITRTSIIRRMRRERKTKRRARTHNLQGWMKWTEENSPDNVWVLYYALVAQNSSLASDNR